LLPTRIFYIQNWGLKYKPFPKNKMLIYKAIIVIIFARTASKSGVKQNCRPLEEFQANSLWLITECPRYVSNLNLYNDLHIPTLKWLSHQFNNRLHSKTTKILLSPKSPPFYSRKSYRRIKINWPRDALKIIIWLSTYMSWSFFNLYYL